jgi:hypothetical protein
MTVRPNETPAFASGPNASITEPSAGEKLLGWVGGAGSQPPPAGFFNWLHKTTNDWVNYFDTYHAGVQRRGVWSGLRLTSLGGGSFSLTAGTIITDEGRRVDVAAIPSLIEITPPSGFSASAGYRIDAIIATYNPAACTLVFSYVQGFNGSPVVDRYIIALLAVKFSTANPPTYNLAAKMYSPRMGELGNVLFLNSGRGTRATMGGDNSQADMTIQNAIDALNAAGGGTLYLAGDFGEFQGANAGIVLKSGVKIVGLGETMLHAKAGGETMWLLRMEGMTTAQGVISGGNAIQVAQIAPPFSWQDYGLGAVVNIAGTHYTVYSISGDGHTALVKDQNGDIPTLADATGVSFEILIVGAGVENVVVVPKNIFVPPVGVVGALPSCAVHFAYTYQCAANRVFLRKGPATAVAGFLLTGNNYKMQIEDCDAPAGYSYSLSVDAAAGVNYASIQNNRWGSNVSLTPATCIGSQYLGNALIGGATETFSAAAQAGFGWQGSVETNQHNTDGSHRVVGLWCAADATGQPGQWGGSDRYAPGYTTAAVVYLGTAPFPSANGVNYPNWYLRHESTGNYEIRPPYSIAANGAVTQHVAGDFALPSVQLTAVVPVMLAFSLMWENDTAGNWFFLLSFFLPPILGNPCMRVDSEFYFSTLQLKA